MVSSSSPLSILVDESAKDRFHEPFNTQSSPPDEYNDNYESHIGIPINSQQWYELNKDYFDPSIQLGPGDPSFANVVASSPRQSVPSSQFNNYENKKSLQTPKSLNTHRPPQGEYKHRYESPIAYPTDTLQWNELNKGYVDHSFAVPTRRRSISPKYGSKLSAEDTFHEPTDTLSSPQGDNKYRYESPIAYPMDSPQWNELNKDNVDHSFAVPSRRRIISPKYGNKLSAETTFHEPIDTLSSPQGEYKHRYESPIAYPMDSPQWNELNKGYVGHSVAVPSRRRSISPKYGNKLSAETTFHEPIDTLSSPQGEYKHRYESPIAYPMDSPQWNELNKGYVGHSVAVPSRRRSISPKYGSKLSAEDTFHEPINTLSTPQGEYKHRYESPIAYPMDSPQWNELNKGYVGHSVAVPSRRRSVIPKYGSKLSAEDTFPEPFDTLSTPQGEYKHRYESPIAYPMDSPQWNEFNKDYVDHSFALPSRRRNISPNYENKNLLEQSKYTSNKMASPRLESPPSSPEGYRFVDELANDTFHEPFDRAFNTLSSPPDESDSGYYFKSEFPFPIKSPPWYELNKDYFEPSIQLGPDDPSFANVVASSPSPSDRNRISKQPASAPLMSIHTTGSNKDYSDSTSRLGLPQRPSMPGLGNKGATLNTNQQSEMSNCCATTAFLGWMAFANNLTVRL